MLDNDWTHRCCAAVTANNSLAGGYHQHLVQQLGSAAPSMDEIKVMGTRVLEASRARESGHCYFCQDVLEKGRICSCLERELPYLLSRAEAERLRAAGSTEPVALFVCSECCGKGTMDAAAVLRAAEKASAAKKARGDTSGLRPAEFIYKKCRRCAQRAAIARKAAAQAAAPAAPAVPAAGTPQAAIEASVALAQKLLDGIRADYAARIEAADAAAHRAGAAAIGADKALAEVLKTHAGVVSKIKELRELLLVNNNPAWVDAQVAGLSKESSGKVASATTRRDAARAEADRLVAEADRLRKEYDERERDLVARGARP